MYIPHINSKINIGDDVILIHDYDVGHGIFTRGHQFKVIDIITNSLFNGNKIYHLIDDNGYMLNIPIANFRKNISHDESKKIHSEKVRISKIINDIKQNCDQIAKCYDDRDTYDGCKKDGYKYKYKECEPKLECILYCKKLHEKYPQLIRKYKIQKLIYNKKR